MHICDSVISLKPGYRHCNFGLGISIVTQLGTNTCPAQSSLEQYPHCKPFLYYNFFVTKLWVSFYEPTSPLKPIAKPGYISIVTQS